MPDHPFHVAGGLFRAHRPASPEIDASFLTRPKVKLAEQPEATNTSRQGNRMNLKPCRADVRDSDRKWRR